MLNRSLVKPLEPTKPDVTMSLEGPSPEWEEYYQKLRAYEKDTELYGIKEEIVTKVESIRTKIAACLEGNKGDIETKLASFGINIPAGSLDRYLHDMEESRENLAQLRDILTNIYTLESQDTAGISYTNDELKTSGKIGDEMARQDSIKERASEEISIQVLLSEYGNLSFAEQKKVYDALKAMGYDGGFGEMDKFIPAFEQIDELQQTNSRLETQNKGLRAEKGVLEATVGDYKAENAALRSENANLSEKMQRVLANVREYKDYVIQTVRDMPIIGKFVAKKLQKEEGKSLGSASVERYI